ncbi:DUF2147 domain-containing protein [Flavobacterium sp. 3HN19-14]|uniref:DUF2147 domain-containing protein n=1 Tax=Flavobacterium sp. 3HN19-14 TaxID=3448133 RepID=UPI003EE14194
MKKYLSLLLLLFTISGIAQHTIIGKWKTIDDETGKAMAVIEIYEFKGKIYGRIQEVINPNNRKHKCDKCPGEDKGKGLIGLNVIKGLTKDGDEYNGGKILDPKSGKLYKCYITLENDDKLKVRGYIGISLIGRTQYWHRVK